MNRKFTINHQLVHFKSLPEHFKAVILSFLRRKSNSFDKVIWIISAPRSGSTWIQTIIQEAFEALVLFEPCHPIFGTYKKHIKGDRIRRGQVSKELVEVIRNSHLHKYWNFWGFQGNNLKLSDSKTLVVKAVRLGSVVPELLDILNFPVIIFRHPCAIAYGQSKIFDKPVDFLKKKATLLQDPLFHQYSDLITSINSNFELRLFLILEESSWHNDIDKYANKIISVFFF
jgi:hypothetical protein